MRRAAVREREQSSVSTFEKGLHSGPTLPYDPVPGEAAERVLQAALRLLEEIGVRFEPGTEADRLLADAGCSVEPNGVVPVGADVVVWNAHRICGHLRLPRFLEGWRVIGSFGYDEAMMHAPVGRWDQPPGWLLTPDGA